MTGNRRQFHGETDEFQAFLAEVLEVTDRLLNAINESNIEALTGALDERELLCSGLSGLRPALESQPAGRTRDLVDSLLSRQSECESLLASKLGECRRALVPLGRRRELNTIYHAPAVEPGAVFLDNLL